MADRRRLWRFRLEAQRLMPETQVAAQMARATCLRPINAVSRAPTRKTLAAATWEGMNVRVISYATGPFAAEAPATGEQLPLGPTNYAISTDCLTDA